MTPDEHRPLTDAEVREHWAAGWTLAFKLKRELADANATIEALRVALVAARAPVTPQAPGGGR
jgi:hypothetical protein